MQKKTAVYFDRYGSTFVKATRGVPVEIVSIRGPVAVKVTCENTEAVNPFVVVIQPPTSLPCVRFRFRFRFRKLYFSVNPHRIHNAIWSVFDDRAAGRAAIGLWKHCYVKRLAVPAGGPVWLIAVKWCAFKLLYMLKQRSYFTSCKAVLIKTPQDMLCLCYDSRRSPLLHLILPIGSLLRCTA